MHLNGLLYQKYHQENRVSRNVLCVDESCHVALLSSEGRGLPMPAHTDEEVEGELPLLDVLEMKHDLKKHICKKQTNKKTKA